MKCKKIANLFFIVIGKWRGGGERESGMRDRERGEIDERGKREKE
jgi:hypothetical protein